MYKNTIMKNYLIILFVNLFIYLNLSSQIINEAFSSTSPDASVWSSTTSSWSLNYNYGASNAHSGSYCTRLSSASNGNGKYLYIKINVTSGKDYNLDFWTKRFCNITVNTNETNDQTSLLYTTTFASPGCSNTWYNHSINYTSTYSGVMYWQILCNTVYGGPTSIYMDDFIITEISALPIKLISFDVQKINNTYNFEWITLSEKNLQQYNIDYTYDGEIFYEIGVIPSVKNTNSKVIHNFKKEDFFYKDIIYFRLSSIDNDGYIERFDLISLIVRPREMRRIVEIYSLTGTKLNKDAKGYVIIHYDDGTTIKTFK